LGVCCRHAGVVLDRLRNELGKSKALLLVCYLLSRANIRSDKKNAEK
jgi:hypothetical protein